MRALCYMYYLKNFLLLTFFTLISSCGFTTIPKLSHSCDKKWADLYYEIHRRNHTSVRFLTYHRETLHLLNTIERATLLDKIQKTVPLPHELSEEVLNDFFSLQSHLFNQIKQAFLDLTKHKEDPVVLSFMTTFDGHSRSINQRIKEYNQCVHDFNKTLGQTYYFIINKLFLTYDLKKMIDYKDPIQ